MSFETELIKAGGGKKLLAELIHSVQQTPDGQKLLALLCSVANPVDQTFCADSRLAAHLAGNREVVATLWRFGAAVNSVPDTTPN